MIIGLFGRIGSGKNTVAKILTQKYNFSQDSFARPLKDIISTIFGYPRDLMEGATPESRRFRETVDPWWAERLQIPLFSPRMAMQLVGTDALREHLHPDIWALSLERRLAEIQGNVVITDCRFSNESDVIEQRGGLTVRIERGPNPEWLPVALSETADADMARYFPQVHLTEWKWMQFEQQYQIDNNDSLEHLEMQIDDIIRIHAAADLWQPTRAECLS